MAYCFASLVNVSCFRNVSNTELQRHCICKLNADEFMHNKKAPRMEIGREMKVVHLPTLPQLG